MPRLRLSAIVPATNDPPTLAECVVAIEAAEEPPDEVIVVTEADARGPAAARNAGAARAKGDVLVFVDADVVPHADAFARIRRSFEQDPGLAGVFGSYDDRPPANGLVSTFRNLLHHHVHQEGRGEATTFWAGLGALRRDAFVRVGRFDEARYPEPSVEDVELGLRLADGGARVLLDPDLLGTHLKAWTVGEMLRTDFARRGVPWTRLLLERGAVPATLNLGWRHRLSAAAVLAGTGALVARRPAAAAGALAALVALNARFYALLARRRGPREAVLGVGLHALHHLASAAAVPAGLAAHVRARTKSEHDSKRHL